MQANKLMHMAAIAYNLKKLLKFTTKTKQVVAQVFLSYSNALLKPILFPISGFIPI